MIGLTNHADTHRQTFRHRRRGPGPAGARGNQEDLPQGEIDWAVEESASDILEGHPLIDHLLVSSRKEWMRLLRRPSTFLRGLKGIIGFISDLRGRRYDIAVDLQGLLKSGVVIGLARAKRKIGFAGTRELSPLFLNERLPAYNIEKHALERYLDVARYLGAVDPQPVCTLPIGRELPVMRERLRGLAAEGRKIVSSIPLPGGRPSSGRRRSSRSLPTASSLNGTPWWC